MNDFSNTQRPTISALTINAVWGNDYALMLHCHIYLSDGTAYRHVDGTAFTHLDSLSDIGGTSDVSADLEANLGDDAQDDVAAALKVAVAKKYNTLADLLAAADDGVAPNPDEELPFLTDCLTA